MNNAGYSGTPLAKKLGIRPGFVIRLIDHPPYYFKLFTDLPDDIHVTSDSKAQKHFIHYFTTDANALYKQLALLKNEIFPSGMIWVSWPKKAAKVETDVTEDVIRNYALSIGLVDIKVCAVDETWSALKLVIPVKDRMKV